METRFYKKLSHKTSIRSRWLFILFFFTLFNFAQGENCVKITFKDTVLVNDTVFKIGDISEVSTSDDLLLSQILQRVAGISAPAGYSRFVNTRDLFLYKIKPFYNAINFEISGAQRTVVKTGYIEKKVGEYERLIIDYFEKTVAWPKGKWKLEIENEDEQWKCLNAPLEVSVEGPDAPYPKGHTTVTLKVTQGIRESSISVLCDISVVIPVIINSKAIMRGENISMQDCELKEMDITRFGPVPITDMNELKSLRAARTIMPGTVLHNRLVQAIPLIEKNEQVEILLKKGRVKVAVQGIARESGGEGELIWVENAASHRIIRAKIAGKGTVMVFHGGKSI